MSETESPISGGVLIELPRDQAKSFFGCRDEASVRDFLETQLADAATHRVEFSSTWPLLAKCFGDGTLAVGSGEPPLAWCFLAGRPMPASENGIVNLLRPDMVGHIATHLSEIQIADWLKERVASLGLEATDDQLDQAATQTTAIQTFCDSAAKNGSAVVFAANETS